MNCRNVVKDISDNNEVSFFLLYTASLMDRFCVNDSFMLVLSKRYRGEEWGTLTEQGLYKFCVRVFIHYSQNLGGNRYISAIAIKLINLKNQDLKSLYAFLGHKRVT